MNLRQESESLDLVGEPFAVTESDPGIFTTLLRKLGVEGLSVVELYSVESYETDHLNAYGLIFCYLCDDGADTAKDLDPGEDFNDPDARSIWFANQLSDDACASQAILNVLLNCKNVRLGANLREFTADTEAMSPVMRGLAISNLSLIREAQNSLARRLRRMARLGELGIREREEQSEGSGFPAGQEAQDNFCSDLLHGERPSESHTPFPSD
ncbi:cysteine proteinase [Cubamyces sp. BRFM 1775]|nr:cysteine proteinase [Cubamyces sp. BRFM 1775]